VKSFELSQILKMAKRKQKLLSKCSKSIYIETECPALDSECNIIILDILCKKTAQTHSCEKYEKDLKKIDDNNVKRGFLNAPKKLDAFKEKYQLFNRILYEDLRDFYFQRIKEKLQIANEDYSQFSKSPSIAEYHLVKSLQSLASAAESKLKRLKPTQWDLRNTLTQVKFEPMDVKDEPMDQIEVSSQPLPLAENVTVKKKN
jgi:hypothetical protein